MHFYVAHIRKRGATYCDCGRILDGISAQVHEQFRIIITESYKPMGTLFGLVWKQSLVVRGGPNYRKPRKTLVSQLNVDSHLAKKDFKHMTNIVKKRKKKITC